MSKLWRFPWEIDSFKFLNYVDNYDTLHNKMIRLALMNSKPCKINIKEIPIVEKESPPISVKDDEGDLQPPEQPPGKHYQGGRL